jgi:hypothetical protein
MLGRSFSEWWWTSAIAFHRCVRAAGGHYCHIYSIVGVRLARVSLERIGSRDNRLCSLAIARGLSSQAVWKLQLFKNSVVTLHYACSGDMTSDKITRAHSLHMKSKFGHSGSTHPPKTCHEFLWRLLTTCLHAMCVLKPNRCRRLFVFRQRFPNVPIMALTATATPRVSQDIMKQLQMKNPVMFTASFNRPNLRYHVIKKSKTVIDDMAERIVEKHFDEFNYVAAGIVYCLSRNDCEKVAEELQVLRSSLKRALLNCANWFNV